MRIGIYGDSYTSINIEPGKEYLGLSWVEHLQKIHEVKNFGQVGTSFRWTYELYLEHRDKFDYNIVVVSHPSRLYIKSLDNHPKKPSGHFFNQSKFIEEFKNSVSNDDKIFNVLDSIQTWVNECMDNQFERHLHRLMIKNLLSFVDTLLIPGFPDSIEDYTANLTEIQHWEILQLDPLFDIYSDIICKRKCHLTEENNEVLFELVKNAIDKRERVLKLDTGFFKRPTRNLDYYVTKLQSVPTK